MWWCKSVWWWPLVVCNFDCTHFHLSKKHVWIFLARLFFLFLNECSKFRQYTSNRSKKKNLLCKSDDSMSREKTDTNVFTYFTFLLCLVNLFLVCCGLANCAYSYMLPLANHLLFFSLIWYTFFVSFSCNNAFGFLRCFDFFCLRHEHNWIDQMLIEALSAWSIKISHH